MVISPIQPCFYCGRVYKEEEINQLLSEGKGETVDLDQIFGQPGMMAPPEPVAKPKSWKWLIYAVIGFLFLIFLIACGLLFLKIKI